ncbi:hypothetical protein ACWIG5_35765 [Streptomyces lydicus]
MSPPARQVVLRAAKADADDEGMERLTLLALGTAACASDRDRDRHQRRRDAWRQRQALVRQRLNHVREPLRRPLRRERPMWQEPPRGALYALGSGLVALGVRLVPEPHVTRR